MVESGKNAPDFQQTNSDNLQM